MSDITQGQILAVFAFDIGYGVSLEDLGDLFPAFPVQPLSRKKRTPPYLQYTRPPRKISLGRSDPHFGREGTIEATIFDFGGASLVYSWPIAESAPLHLEDTPELAQSLYELNLEDDATARIRALMETIDPAIERPRLSPLVEDFYVFVFEKLDSPRTADDLLAEHGHTLAQLLRLENAALSSQQREDALATRISYYENDLVLIDWNAAVIYDQDYEDTVNILELLNVELLEARYIDTQLDKHIQEYSSIVHKQRVFPIPLRAPYGKAIQELAELRSDSSLLAERVENSLKLVGDLYLARVHTAGAERFHLKEWDHIISSKLDIIASFYDLLTDRVRTAQSQTLELVVVVLILLELLFSIAPWRH
jgi:hypothetical protein